MTRRCSVTILRKLLNRTCNFEDPVEKMKCVLGEYYGYSYNKVIKHRRLVCGCVHACNGGAPPIVIAVEGTPPKGILMIPDSDIPWMLIVRASYMSACILHKDLTPDVYKSLMNLVKQVIERQCKECTFSVPF